MKAHQFKFEYTTRGSTVIKDSETNVDTALGPYNYSGHVSGGQV